VKAELGIDTGKRYSWGYGACPDLEDHAVVFKLLPAAEEIGLELTESFQLTPEQSTAAVIMHHPEAKYYAVRGAAAEREPALA
jgi:5-methyltetrahydrofolate--homocysteine methyltransferase